MIGPKEANHDRGGRFVINILLEAEAEGLWCFNRGFVIEFDN